MNSNSLRADDLETVLVDDGDNPNFSLNGASLPASPAVSMAGTLGVSIKNVAEGIGTLSRKGVEGVGSAVKRSFGGATKK